MKAGAGKAEIKFPEEFFPVEGFTKILSPLYVRTFILKSETSGFALLSAELTSLPDYEVDLLKEILSKRTGIDRDCCWVTVTHTFSSPHFLPPGFKGSEEQKYKNKLFQDIFIKAAEESITQAMRSMTAVRLKFGKANCSVNINRDIELPEGWWVGNSGIGPSDPTLSVLTADDMNGQPVIVLVHYSVQSSIMDGSVDKDGGKAVTSDLAGEACRLLEEKYTHAVAAFLMGAAGDQAPVKKARTLIYNPDGSLTEINEYEKGVAYIKELGLQIFQAAAEAIDKSELLDKENIKSGSVVFTVPGKYMPNLKDLKPTRKMDYISQDDRLVKVEAMTIGDIAFVGVKPELNCVTALQIIRDSPYGSTLVMSMVNGGAKYMADKDSYDRYTYEAMNSPFNKGAAEILSEHTKTLLKQLYIRK